MSCPLNSATELRRRKREERKQKITGLVENIKKNVKREEDAKVWKSRLKRTLIAVAVCSVVYVTFKYLASWSSEYLEWSHVASSEPNSTEQKFLYTISWALQPTIDNAVPWNNSLLQRSQYDYWNKHFLAICFFRVPQSKTHDFSHVHFWISGNQFRFNFKAVPVFTIN